MVGGLTILLLFQLAGELITTGFDLPIPGPVIGMGLLFVALLVRGRESDAGNQPGLPAGLERAAQGLLDHLSLLFVPAGCGVITYSALIRQEWLPITVSLIGSTLLTIAVTALTMQALLGLRSARKAALRDSG
jgi:holin-like protein